MSDRDSREYYSPPDSSEQHYQEVCEENGWHIYNTGEADYSTGTPGTERATDFQERAVDVEEFISSADDKLHTVTRGAASYASDSTWSSSPSTSSGSQASGDQQKTAKEKRKNWRGVLSSAASQVRKVKVTLRSSSEPASDGQTRSDERPKRRNLVIQHPTLGECQGSTLSLSAASTSDEPIYASVRPRRRNVESAAGEASAGGGASRRPFSGNPPEGPTASLAGATASLVGTTASLASTTALRAGANAADAHAAAADARALPAVCAEFAAECECEWRECPHLHVCAEWLSGECPLLRRCHRPHSLRTAHNLMVLQAAGWREDERSDVRRWLQFQAGCEKLEADGLPPLCVDHARAVCRAQPCDALHMCPHLMTNTNTCYERRCTLGHDLLADENNRRVLALHGHDNVVARNLLRSMQNSMAVVPRFF